MGLRDLLSGEKKEKKDDTAVRENIEKIRQKVQEQEGGRSQSPAGMSRQERMRGPPQPPERQQPEQETRRAEPPQESDVPSPPEVRDLDIPDIEKGPLFITVQKFRQAVHTLSELERVADNLDAHVDALEGTRIEDQQLGEEMADLLQQAESQTDLIEDVVSP